MLYIVIKAPKRNKPHLLTAAMIVEASTSRAALVLAQATDPSTFLDLPGDLDCKKTKVEALVCGKTFTVGN